MLDYENHPGPMDSIGRAYFYRDDYPEARKWFQQCLTAAGDDLLEEAARAWHQLASIDLRVGDYEAARQKFQTSLEIKQQIGDRAGEADTWHQLASIDLNVGDYEAARAKFQTSLEIKQRIGNRAGEAETWHQLASIDAEVGDYGAARAKSQAALIIFQQIGYRAGESATWHNLGTIDMRVSDYEAARAKFQTSLEIKQQIGDRVGEAAAFYQLGFLATELGRLAEGIRLVAVCFLIDQAIGHGDTESDWRMVSQMAAKLNYTPEQVDVMLQEVVEAYKANRGAGLIQAAFGSE